jgi:hypothetical protein
MSTRKRRNAENKPARKKLRLNKETVRDLTPKAEKVSGGQIDPLNPSAGFALTCHNC